MKRCCLARSSRPKAPWGSPWCSNPLLSLRHAPRRHQSLGTVRRSPWRRAEGKLRCCLISVWKLGIQGDFNEKNGAIWARFTSRKGIYWREKWFWPTKMDAIRMFILQENIRTPFLPCRIAEDGAAPLGEEASWQVLTLCRSDILKLKLLIGRSTFSMCFDQISPLAKLTEGKDMSHALMQMIGGNIWADEMKGGGPNESTSLNLNPMWIFYRGWDWCPFLGLFGHHQNSHICWNWNIPILVGWCPPSWGEHPMDGLQPSIGCSMGHPSCKLVSKPHQHPLVNSYIYHKPYLSQL